MNQYLIPANSKKSLLIANVFEPIDLIIIGCGVAISLIVWLLMPGDDLFMLVIKLLPLSLSLLLVVPIPHYHNVRVFLREFILYATGEKEYIWKGWCASSEDYDEKVGKSTN